MTGRNGQPGESARMGTFLAATRREILRRLYESGSQPLGALHRGWPMTKYHARLVVRALTEEGLVEVADVDGNIWSRRVGLTPAGRASGLKASAEAGPRPPSARETGPHRRRASDKAAAEGLLQQDPPQSTAA